MNNEQKKQNLAKRVNLAIKDHYKTKQETQKRKTCTVCGKGFLGQDGASSCSPKCRMKKSRES